MASKGSDETLMSEGTDRISDLPNPILAKIVSYLPTKYAIATSILSTRWKNVFAFAVPPIKLDLDDSLFCLHPAKYELFAHDYSLLSNLFIDFVDKLFNKTLYDVCSLDTLILKCRLHYGGDAKIISWVCAALRLNVQCLDFYTALDDSSSLFRSLHGCTTLVSLELGEGLKLCLPDGLRLPNLKSLTLNGLKFIDHKINGLIDSCPVLESLCMRYCCFQNVDAIYIRSPLLKRFVIQNCYGCYSQSPRRLMLDVPNLRVLIYDNWYDRINVVSNFKSLDSAHISYFPQSDVNGGPDTGLAELTTACSSTVLLYLTDSTINALHRMSVDLPTFQNLAWLKLAYAGWGILARLLCSAPNLEKLVFEQGFIKGDGCCADFESLISTPPICLESHLKEIDFLEFIDEEEEDALKLIEYILNNGKVMKKMKLHYPQHIKNSCSLNRLHRLYMKPTIFMTFACWKDELLLKYMSSHPL